MPTFLARYWKNCWEQLVSWLTKTWSLRLIFQNENHPTNMKKQIFFVPRKCFAKNTLRLCQVENKIFKRTKEAFSPHQSHWWDASSWQEKRQFYVPVSLLNLSTFWEVWRKSLSHFFSKKKLRKKWSIQSLFFTSWMNMTIIPLN